MNGQIIGQADRQMNRLKDGQTASENYRRTDAWTAAFFIFDNAAKLYLANLCDMTQIVFVSNRQVYPRQGGQKIF
jgi:hypothetical protein